MASNLLRGLVLGFAIAASPGPIFFLCLKRTLARGWVSGIASGLGVATGDGIYAALAAFGVAAITSALVAERRWLALGLTLTNPATILAFAAVFTVLGLGTTGGRLTATLLVLGVLLGSAAWWVLLATVGAVLRTRVTPAVVRGITVLSGLAILAFGTLAVISAVTGYR
jgi:threonine/homoserine/homoserine lactone efflux protein